MKIVALYKVWSGEEWLRASVDSIYKHVDKIVLLTSDVSWIGGRENPSLKTISLIQDIDPEHKIIHLNHDEPNQLLHCQWGYDWIQRNEPCDFVQLIDSDELWDDENLIRAKRYLEENPGFEAYRAQMYTYIKKITFRVDPPEPLKPVCFVAGDLYDLGSQPRGCTLSKCFTMPKAWCHHYVFVRERFNAFLEKLIQSHVSECQSYEQMDLWLRDVWANLPNVPESWTAERGGFHPAIGYQKNWKGIKVLKETELPETLRKGKNAHMMEWGN